ncbi:DNA polymerase III subunit beta [Desulfococcus multivorans]|jgi:DNA polymerase-3 subunit beta|uniref:Beta sliding clamp n=1 Tax=Desulfococcus multivorans DSM 2059 TaxID=1121405 RepID=S7TFK3_DESML|nr:DNA polymerase III subunit beta [Desulfococcus multivorans]AOY60685.1 DnaN: DNA polymerase III, subunit beta [Desulfococcus multivorans]AQV02766.1 DNA polymerase III subunit beta [Desulfococcus multivorans]EPR35531.1 DNA polymerase III, beta subunit [Desulfococcus multivorans DSM 2059]MDX9818499.1 DNA polymerase III subunit beta [Desulfococcus multivorans]SKA28422.1 DNA polymerase-3 subunit beta [Desulfococcus multivorans DSM 2059]
MKFVINKNDIRNILGKVQGITGRRTNLAITETVLIQAKEQTIKIVATDLETGFEGEYPATVESEGTIAINAKKLFEIVRDFPSDSIDINEVENRWIEIGKENIEYHIVGMNPEDFPDIPQVDDAPLFEMDTQSLKRMIEKTIIIGGAPDDKRAHINGIYFENLDDDDSKTLKMVSTDGSRLSTVDYPYENGVCPIEKGVLIPKKGLGEVLKFLGPEKTVAIGLKDSHFVLKKENESFTIRLLEGEYPNYKDIIVRGIGHDVPVDRQLFLMVLKRMSILSSENYRGVIFNFEKNLLTVRATNPEIGESREDMVIKFAGDPIEAAFNPKYFIDSLGVIEDETAVINIVSSDKPCLVEGEKDKSYLSIIMPMKI